MTDGLDGLDVMSSCFVSDLGFVFRLFFMIVMTSCECDISFFF